MSDLPCEMEEKDSLTVIEIFEKAFGYRRCLICTAMQVNIDVILISLLITVVLVLPFKLIVSIEIFFST